MDENKSKDEIKKLKLALCGAAAIIVILLIIIIFISCSKKDAETSEADSGNKESISESTKDNENISGDGDSADGTSEIESDSKDSDEYGDETDTTKDTSSGGNLQGENQGQSGVNQNQGGGNQGQNSGNQSQNSGSIGASGGSFTYPVESGTPLANHGRLRVSGVNLVDESGDVYQLRGVSTHGISWFPQYVNYDAFKTLRDEWNVNTVRLAMYVREYNGYTSGGNRDELKKIIDNGVNYATQLGMYVIIDWHVLAFNPNETKGEAVTFWNEISAKYAGHNNVLYEICNEPTGSDWNSQIKPYAQEIVSAIRKNDANAVIIVGTNTWSQDVDAVVGNKLSDGNCMYALHFYAGTHQSSIWNKLIKAMDGGVPVFVSECSICDASGNGGINYDSANQWADIINKRKISIMAWSLCNKNETSALIASSCTKLSGWTDGELSDTGRWFKKLFTNGKNLTGSETGAGNSGGNGNGGGAGNSGSAANNGNNSGNVQNNGGSNVTVQPETEKKTVVDASLSYSLEESGGWEENGQFVKQYTVTVKNIGDSQVTSWELVIPDFSGYTFVNGWCADVKSDGNRLVIKPLDWNGVIEKGGLVSGIGLQIKSPSKDSRLPDGKISGKGLK